MIAWAQVKQTTIVNSDVFKVLYLHSTGGDEAKYRTGIQYADQFFQINTTIFIGYFQFLLITNQEIMQT